MHWPRGCWVLCSSLSLCHITAPWSLPARSFLVLKERQRECVQVSQVFLAELLQYSHWLWDEVQGELFMGSSSSEIPCQPLFFVSVPSAEPDHVLCTCSSILKRLIQTQTTWGSFDSGQHPSSKSSLGTGDIPYSFQPPFPDRGGSHGLGWSSFTVRFIFNWLCRWQTPPQRGPAPSSCPAATVNKERGFCCSTSRRELPSQVWNTAPHSLEQIRSRCPQEIQKLAQEMPQFVWPLGISLSVPNGPHLFISST